MTQNQDKKFEEEVRDLVNKIMVRVPEKGTVYKPDMESFISEQVTSLLQAVRREERERMKDATILIGEADPTLWADKADAYTKGVKFAKAKLLQSLDTKD